MPLVPTGGEGILSSVRWPRHRAFLRPAPGLQVAVGDGGALRAGVPAWVSAGEAGPRTHPRRVGAQRGARRCLASGGLEARLRSHISRSLDGFAFALNQKGRLYTSETVSIDLGLSRAELTGSGAFDSAHPRDRVEMARQPGTMLPPGRVLLSQGAPEDRAGSASSSQSEAPSQVGTAVLTCGLGVRTFANNCAQVARDCH